MTKITGKLTTKNPKLVFNSAEYFGSTDDAFIFKVVDVMHIPARRFNYTCIVLYVIFFR